MLNELHMLSVALERAGIHPTKEHPRMKDPGKAGGPCIRVRLDHMGRVLTVEEVTSEEWPGLWTIREGNQDSRPVVRKKEPLIVLAPNDPLWDRLDFDVVSALVEIVGQRPPQLSKKGYVAWRRLQEKAVEFESCAQRDQRAEMLGELGRRFRIAAEEPDRLLKEISHHLALAAQQDRLDQRLAVVLLVGKRKSGDSPAQAVMQFAFDLDDQTYPRGIYTGEQRDIVKAVLPLELEERQGHRTQGADNGALACALTGESGDLQDGAFPRVRLPVLNKEFPLVSMFSDAACNERYGLTDSRVVPVAKREALRLQDAWAWVVAQERKGRTWRGVANGKFEPANRGRQERQEIKDLLIVYVDGKPQMDSRIADLFGSDDFEQDFALNAGTVCEALDGLLRERPDSKLQLFVIRQLSQGQVHVAIAESPTVTEVLDAAAWWQKAAANIPIVQVPMPNEKGMKTFVTATPRPPYPDRLVRLLSEQWVVSGTRSTPAQGVSLREVLDLLLRKPEKVVPLSARMLDLTLERSQPLLLGLFGALHAGVKERLDAYPYQARLTGLLAVSTLGILLSSLDRVKEKYMDDTAFLLGRLLSLADTLHREYCKHVRDGAVPPQLIGNALMPAAADNPQDAVDRLRERILIYKAWADKSDGQEYALAKWAVGQMGEISARLHELTLPPRTDRVFRAELLLGYLARSTTKEKEGAQLSQGEERHD